MHEFKATIMRLREPEGIFARERPVYAARAPGRIDLMGGNADYTGGLVFQMTTREATLAASQLRDDGRVVLLNPGMRSFGWSERASLPAADLSNPKRVREIANASPEMRWTAYVLGPLHFLYQRAGGRLNSGVSLYIESSVPLNKGVSSSAAVEVAVMKSAAEALGIKLGGVELARACQWAENVIAEAACGIMDQAAVALGEEGSCLPLLCQPCIPYSPVRIPEELAIKAIDSGVRHAVTGQEYEAARAACFMGYALIAEWENLPLRLDESDGIARWIDPRWNGYPSDIPPSVFRALYERRLPETMTGAEFLACGRVLPDPFTKVRPEGIYPVRACMRYAVEENQRIKLFVELIRGKPSVQTRRLLGEQMLQSHYSYTECGLGSEATDQIVNLVREDPALYGAKITGGGSGGTVVILGDAGDDEPFQRVTTRYAEIIGSLPHVFEGSSQGADQFGVQTL
ncbi:MAG: galactokinase [Acidobacteriota bacterium]|nr:galactokinase [Acidobacteriota bacterium]